MATISIGASFIPLLDAAPLIVAKERGIDEMHGIALRLHRSTSWAGLRDRLSVGIDQCAHMLAPIPIASQLGLGNPKAPMVVPCGLSMNGNAISVSTALFDAMQKEGWSPDQLREPARAAKALAAVVRKKKDDGEPPLTFASVYPFSSHAYELRYWLASAGLDPDRDVLLTIVPPPQMVSAIKDGHIDGYCVGAPWNAVGSESGASQLVALKVDLWAHGPEKVLAMREDWADAHRDTVLALVRMIVDAARWCSDRHNHAALAQILSGEDYLAMDPRLVAAGLSGTLTGLGGQTVDNYLLFDPDYATYPWRAHALWFYAQMVRWGQVDMAPNHADMAKRTYRPDIYATAIGSKGMSDGLGAAADQDAPYPADLTLFDGRRFDPHDLTSYLAGFAISAGR